MNNSSLSPNRSRLHEAADIIQKLQLIAQELPAHRRFDDAVREATSRGAKCLWLSVSDKNLRAQRFYEKLGFLPAGRGPDFHVGTDTLTSKILVLELNQASRNST